MPNAELSKQLTDLFMATGKAHHQAFIESDGADPDWALWYADHLREPLGEQLDATFTKSELVYLLVLADRDLNTNAPGAKWPAHFARFFIDRYL